MIFIIFKPYQVSDTVRVYRRKALLLLDCYGIQERTVLCEIVSKTFVLCFHQGDLLLFRWASSPTIGIIAEHQICTY